MKRLKRQERQQAKWVRRLAPVLLPVLQSLERLEHPVRPKVELGPLMLLPPSQELTLLQEQRELLLELLNSLQPPPEQEIARRLGLPTQPPSSPSLVS